MAVTSRAEEAIERLKIKINNKRKIIDTQAKASLCREKGPCPFSRRLRLKAFALGAQVRGLKGYNCFSFA